MFFVVGIFWLQPTCLRQDVFCLQQAKHKVWLPCIPPPWVKCLRLAFRVWVSWRYSWCRCLSNNCLLWKMRYQNHGANRKSKETWVKSLGQVRKVQTRKEHWWSNSGWCKLAGCECGLRKGFSEGDGFPRWRYAPLYQTISARRNTRSGIASACVYQGASFTDDATSSCSWSERPR